MKQGWEIKKLGEVCEINPSKKEAIKKLVLNDKVSFLPMEDLGINAYYITPSQERSLSEVLSSYTYFADGDVLLAKVSPCFENGKIGIANNLTNGVGFGSSEYLTFRLGKDIVKEFLYFYLQNKTFVKEATKNLTGTSGLRRVPKSFVESCKIPCPPIEEQEKIVEELDCLSGVIEKKKQQLKELDALAESIFYTMFGDPITNEKGWEIKPLKESVKEMFLGPFGSALKTDCYVNKEDSYCMVYEQKHAIKKTMEVETHYIDRMKFESLKRFEVHSGDFIMSCRGTIGEIYRLPNSAPIGIIHPSLMKIRIKEDVYHSTFFIRLLTRIVKNEDTNGNCVQMAITAKELGAKQLIIPSFSLQQEFADKISLIEKQKQLIKKSIEETETLFNARMDYYFN